MFKPDGFFYTVAGLVTSMVIIVLLVWFGVTFLLDAVFDERHTIAREAGSLIQSFKEGMESPAQ